MIADRRSSKRSLVQAVSLVAALAVALTARPIAAAPRIDAAAPTIAPFTVPVPTRIEGQIQSIAGDTWRVDDFTVKLSPTTTVFQVKGAAQPLAWVLVAGTRYENYLAAEVIEVLRSAGPAPTYQLTGALGKQSGTFWFVGDQHVQITSETKKIGDLVPGAFVRASVRQAGAEWVALEVRALAQDPESVPLALEGVVQQVNDRFWVVDETPVKVPPQQGLQVNQGDTVEVSARDEQGSLVALEARVVDQSREASMSGYVSAVDGLEQDIQTWTLIVFEGSQASTQTLHVTPETYVDEDRAVIEPEVEAHVQGVKAGATSVNADHIRLDRPVPAVAAGMPTPGAANGLWLVGSQRVWLGSEQLMNQAMGVAGLQDARSPLVGSGGAPASIVVTGVRLSNGVLVAKQVLTAQEAAAAGVQLDSMTDNGASAAGAAGANSIDWRGPNGISPAVQAASKPTVLFESSGAGHAVYESMGHIYYCYQPADGAWGEPRKIGTGISPTAVLDAHELVHVAYRSEFLTNYDIMAVRMLPGGKWTYPTVVAPTSGGSADPAITADATGKVYIAWMDATSGEWTIQLGVWDGRYWTSYPAYYARGKSPALTIMADGALFLAWQDRIPLGGDMYGKSDIFVSERKDRFWTLPVNVSDNQTWRPGSDSLGVALSTAQDGLAHLAWTDDNSQVRYLFGRIGYWPVPVDIGPARSAVHGLSLRSAVDGLLYVAWVEGDAIRVVASPLRTQTWPGAETVALRGAPSGGSVGDISLTASTQRLAISWVERATEGTTGVYESRLDTARQVLRSYLPLILNP